MNIGVYKIENVINKKKYIGSTETIGFNKRRNKHKTDLKNNNHHSIYLQRSWNKYGENNFIFEIVELCDSDKCIEREQYYLDLLKPSYNICKRAGNTKGFKFSKKYCNKLKSIRCGVGNPFYGKTHTCETKKYFSELNKKRKSWIGVNNPKFNNGKSISGKKNPFYGKTHTEFTKSILSSKMKGKFSSEKHPNYGGKYEFYNKEIGTFIGGQCDICKFFNLHPSKISMICTGKRNHHKGWKFIKKIFI